MKKKDYWSTREDKLCSEWVTTTCRKEQLRIYNGLHPALKIMILSIVRRYFYRHEKEEEFVPAFVNKVLLSLKLYDEDRKGVSGWYSYIQMIIKNYCYDYFEITRYNKGSKTDYIEEQDVDIPIEVHYFQDETKKLVLNYLKYQIGKIEKEIEAVDKKRYKPTYIYKRYKYLVLMLEYFEKFNHFELRAANEYVLQNNDLELTTNAVDYFNRTYFKINTKYKYSTDDERAKKQDEFNYLHDDYCPDDKDFKIPRRRKRIEDNDFLYF